MDIGDRTLKQCQTWELELELERRRRGVGGEIKRSGDKGMYDLGLNEIMPLEEKGKTNYIWIRRVPGGWIYEYRWPNCDHNVVFVPYHNGFIANKSDTRSKRYGWR